MATATKARVLIFGTGSVGTIAAHALETGRQAAVTVICRSNYAAVSKNGFTIDSIEHGRDIKAFYPSTIRNTIPNLLQEKDLQPYDYLVITTKNTPDIPPSLPDLISPAVTRGKTSILLLQNGLNIERPFLARFPHNTILSGVSLIGATETVPGVVRHDGRDKAYIGVFPSHSPALSPSESESKARKFVEMYNANGAVTWEYDRDVLKWRWKKLVYNAAFSSIAALTGLDTGAMRMSRFVVEDLVRPAMLEIVAVAKAAGVELPEDIHETFIRIDPAEKRYLPSMGVDVKKGNFIELENIIGEPVREAERLGIPAPTLRTLYNLLRGIQLRTKEAKGLWEAKFDDDNPYR